MHLRAMSMILVTGLVVIAAEWTGRRRQELIARVVMGMIFLLYVLWKFAPAKA